MSDTPGFWQRLKSVFYSTPAAQTAAYGMIDTLFPVGQPPRKGTRELMRAVRTQPWLHAAVFKIAFEIARTEFGVYKADRPALVRYGRGQVRKGWQKSVSVRGATRLETHPFIDVLEHANPLLGSVLTLTLIQAYLDTKGECPVVLERAADGKVLELWPVPPHWLQRMPTPDDPFWHFSYAGWNRAVPEADCLYLRMPDLEQPYGRGSGTAESLGDELDIDEFAAQHMKSYFFNRALPDAFVAIKGVVNGRKAEEEIERFEQKLADKHRGVGKGWRPHFVTGDVTVTPVGSSLKDQQMAELRNLQRDTLLQVYGIPPEVMGIVENSNRATIASAIYIYSLNVLVPRLHFLCDAFQPLLTEWDPSLFLTFASPLEEDKEFKFRVMQGQPSVFYKNEFRALAGEEPVPDFVGEFAGSSPAPFGSSPPASATEGSPGNAGADPAEEPGEDLETDDAEAA